MLKGGKGERGWIRLGKSLGILWNEEERLSALSHSLSLSLLLSYLSGVI